MAEVFSIWPEVSESENPRLTAALEYAAKGWAVIPLHNPVQGRGCSCHKKQDCRSIGKHPRFDNWQSRATTDEATIRSWWAELPDANVGIATGKISGLFVLDIDNKTNSEGSASLAELEARYGALPVTPVAQSGTGQHFYFACPGFPMNNRVRLAPGIDLRADGGLIVAPPSRHATGPEYDWLVSGVPLASAPEWVLDLILGSSTPPSPTLPGAVFPRTTVLDSLEIIYEGQRNDTLFRLASSMRGRGLEQPEIETALLEVNASKCSPPLESDEVAEIAASVDRYVPGKRPAMMLGNPADCNPLHWMKVLHREVFAHPVLSQLKDYQFGWRIRLEYRAFDNGGILPNSIPVLARIAMPESVDRFRKELDEVLFDFIPHQRDGQEILVNDRLVALYVDQMKRYKQQCEASAKAIEAKKARRFAEGNGDHQPG